MAIVALAAVRLLHPLRNSSALAMRHTSKHSWNMRMRRPERERERERYIYRFLRRWFGCEKKREREKRKLSPRAFGGGEWEVDSPLALLKARNRLCIKRAEQNGEIALGRNNRSTERLMLSLASPRDFVICHISSFPLITLYAYNSHYNFLLEFCLY